MEQLVRMIAQQQESITSLKNMVESLSQQSCCSERSPIQDNSFLESSSSQKEKRTKEMIYDEIGFFDPEYEETDAIVNVSKHVFYHNVYSCVDCLKTLARSQSHNKIWIVIPQIFRRSALIWHSSELLEKEKDLFHVTSLET